MQSKLLSCWIDDCIFPWEFVHEYIEKLSKERPTVFPQSMYNVCGSFSMFLINYNINDFVIHLNNKSASIKFTNLLEMNDVRICFFSPYMNHYKFFNSSLVNVKFLFYYCTLFVLEIRIRKLRFCKCSCLVLYFCYHFTYKDVNVSVFSENHYF